MPLAFQGYAQTDKTGAGNTGFKEDTARVTPLNDIIAMQESVFEKKYRSKFISGVFERRKFFTVSYANTTLSGKNLMIYNPETAKMEKQNAKYKSEWGVAIKRSHIIALHKKPLADMVSLGLEFSALDISANYFKKADDFAFDSRLTFEEGKKNNSSTSIYTDKKHYMPWGSDMYTFSYGMHLGPSVTLAPFAKQRNPGLAHIRLQTYFTLGYRASLMWLQEADENDLNYIENKDNSNWNRSSEQKYFENVSNSSKLLWSHGLVTNWGIRLNWKGIGLGYEIASGSYKYKSTEKKIFGKAKYKFSEKSHRISLSYIW